MNRLRGLLLVLAGCHSSPTEVGPAVDAPPPAATRSCTFGVTRYLVDGALTISKVASDGTNLYAAITTRTAGSEVQMIGGAVIANGDFVDIAGADGTVFYAVRSGSSFELHAFVPPATDTKLADVPAVGPSIAIDASATTVYVRGSSDTMTTTVWSIPRAGGTLATVASYTPAGTLGAMRANDDYVTWDETGAQGTHAIIVTLSSMPATIGPDGNDVGALHHTVWNDDVYGARLEQQTSHYSGYEIYQLTPAFRSVSMSQVANDTFRSQTFFGDGELLFQSTGSSGDAGIGWSGGDCNFDPAALYHGDANHVLAVDAGAVYAIQTH
ncbi:MAG: hypothetical protein QM831_05385 [Kofleriaceae bacterium]